MPEKIVRDVRRMILEVARKKFLHFGLRKTTMEEISRELRISKKTLYAEFESKQQIWNELVQIELKKTAEYLKTYLASDVSPLERLGKLGGYYMRRQLQSAEEERDRQVTARVIGTFSIEPEEDTARMLREEALNVAFPLLVEGLIIEAQEAEEAIEGDPWLLSQVVVGLIDAAAKAFRERPIFPEAPPVKDYLSRFLARK